MQLTGVPACDAYLARYRRCVEESAPENIRDTMLKAIDESHRAFIEEAKAPVNHPRMSRACEAALEAVRHNGASWGCVP